LHPRVDFIVTNLSRPSERVVRFYNGRGTAERWIKEGKNALRWTRLSCRAFRHNAVRLQLHVLADNIANFLRMLVLLKEIEQLSLTTLREKLVKISARIVRHSVPAGRGGSAAGPVRQDPASHRRPAATFAAVPGLRSRRDENCHPTDEVRAFMIRAQPIATQRRLRASSHGCAGFWRLVVAHRTLPIALAWRIVLVRQTSGKCRLSCLGWCLARLCYEMEAIHGRCRNIRSVPRCPVHPGRWLRVLHGL
jgi:hypothetical protein